MRSLARPFLAALLAVAASVPALAWAQEGAAKAARAPVNQPALKQAPAPQTRSAQGDCVRCETPAATESVMIGPAR